MAYEGGVPGGQLRHRGVRKRARFLSGKTTAANAWVVVAGQGVAALVSAVWLIVAARLLTVAQFGDLALALAVLSIASSATGFGVSIAVPALVGRHPSAARIAVASACRLRFVAVGAAAPLVVAAFVVASQSGSVAVGVVVTVSLAATAAYSTFTAGFRGLGRVLPEALNEIVSRIALLGLGTLAVTQGGGVLAVAGSYAIIDVASLAVLGLLAWRTFPRAARMARPRDLQARSMMSLGGFAVLMTAYLRLDVWLLGLLGDAGATAIYAASGRVAETLLLPAAAIASVGVVELGRLCPEARRRRGLSWAARVAAALLVPATAIAVLSGPLLTHLFGEPYGDGAATLAVLMLGCPLGAAVLVLTQVFGLDRRRQLFRLTAVALLVRFIGAIIVIPQAGATGLAVVATGSQVVLVWLLVRSLITAAPEAQPERPPLRSA